MAVVLMGRGLGGGERGGRGGTKVGVWECRPAGALVRASLRAAGRNVLAPSGSRCTYSPPPPRTKPLQLDINGPQTTRHAHVQVQRVRVATGGQARLHPAPLQRQRAGEQEARVGVTGGRGGVDGEGRGGVRCLWSCGGERRRCRWHAWVRVGALVGSGAGQYSLVSHTQRPFPRRKRDRHRGGVPAAPNASAIWRYGPALQSAALHGAHSAHSAHASRASTPQLTDSRHASRSPSPPLRSPPLFPPSTALRSRAMPP